MKAIVLGAGKGERLQSEKFNKPKVLREISGRTLLSYVLDNINFICQEEIYIVVGYKKEMVIESIKGKYNFVTQEEQLGTGHAVMMAEPLLEDYEGDVLVLYGDMPLMSTETFVGLINAHKESNSYCTILTASVDNPPDYGRIIRDDNGRITDVVEKKSCSPVQCEIKEINVGVYVFNSKLLFENLKFLNNNNSQKEYYLTDLTKILIGNGVMVNTYTINNSSDIYGVNTMEDLEFCKNVLRRRLNND